MGNFNRDKRSGNHGGAGGGMGFKKRNSGSHGFGNGRAFSDRDGGRPEMHQAICSECGKECEVPFRPTGDRPVFCLECFGVQSHKTFGRQPERTGGKSFARPSFEGKKMYDAVCADCGNDCQVPFRPNGEKPVYCSQCFDKDNRSSKSDNSRGKGPGPDQFKQQLEMLNNKLDKILRILNPVVVAETIPIEKVAKKAAAVKAVEKKATKKKKK